MSLICPWVKAGVCLCAPHLKKAVYVCRVCCCRHVWVFAHAPVCVLLLCRSLVCWPQYGCVGWSRTPSSPRLGNLEICTHRRTLPDPHRDTGTNTDTQRQTCTNTRTVRYRDTHSYTQVQAHTCTPRAGWLGWIPGTALPGTPPRPQQQLGARPALSISSTCSRTAGWKTEVPGPLEEHLHPLSLLSGDALRIPISPSQHPRTMATGVCVVWHPVDAGLRQFLWGVPGLGKQKEAGTSQVEPDLPPKVYSAVHAQVPAQHLPCSRCSPMCVR